MILAQQVVANFEALSYPQSSGFQMEGISYAENTEPSSTFSWTLDGVQFGTSPLVSTSLLAGSYDICLTVTNSTSVDTKCKTLTAPESCSDQVDCHNLLVNGHFEIINDPSSPGTIESSLYFSSGMCGWNYDQSTPFYCSYQNDSYIAIKAAKFAAEGIRATIPADLQLSKSYRVNLDYSSQLSLGPNGQAVTNFDPADPIEIVLGNSNFSSSQVIGTITPTQVDFPSNTGSFMTTDYFCYDNLTWNSYITPDFEITNPDHKYLRISYAGNEPVGQHVFQYLFLNKIEIECVCEPEISIGYVGDDCDYTFTATNTGTEGVSYWEIEGGPAGVMSPTVSHSFTMNGTYDVCYVVTCNSNQFERECVTVEVTGCDEGCLGAYAPLTNLTKKCNETTYRGNVAIPIASGYQPCQGGDLMITPLAPAGASVTSYEQTFITDANNVSTLHLSLEFDTQPGGGYSVILCDDNGGSACFVFGIQGSSECDVCQTSTAQIQAVCTDSDTENNIYTYRGAFTFTPPPNSISCGEGMSDIPSLNYTEDPNPDGSVTVEFDITNDVNIAQEGFLTLCYIVGDDKLCIDFLIDIVPCSDCAAHNTGSTVTCTRLENGQAVFDISNILFIDDLEDEGFRLCDGNEIEMEFGSFQLIDDTYTSSGYFSNFLFFIDCDFVRDVGDINFELNYCNGIEEFCARFTVDLLCSGCPQSRPRSISNEIDRSIKISPNPTYDKLHIISDDLDSTYDLQIVNLAGVVVRTIRDVSSGTEIDISDLQKGVYLLTDLSENGFEVKKIIKL